MKFALVNAERSEAKPNLNGVCPVCGGRVIAHCGDIKIWHWKHKSKNECDYWWENETEWHRNWKDCFPVEWQEIIHKDQNGEKHIADVKTCHNWVIEFQHSCLKNEEKIIRSKFYNKIVWVIDGRRLENDLKQFNKALEHGRIISNTPFVSRIDADESKIVREWAHLSKPVVLDFGETLGLFLIYPDGEYSAYVFRVAKEYLLESFRDNGSDSFMQFLNAVSGLISDIKTSQRNAPQLIARPQTLRRGRRF